LKSARRGGGDDVSDAVIGDSFIISETREVDEKTGRIACDASHPLSRIFSVRGPSCISFFLAIG
jgi:hypothetical protein